MCSERIQLPLHRERTYGKNRRTTVKNLLRMRNFLAGVIVPSGEWQVAREEWSMASEAGGSEWAMFHCEKSVELASSSIGK